MAIAAWIVGGGIVVITIFALAIRILLSDDSEYTFHNKAAPNLRSVLLGCVDAGHMRKNDSSTRAGIGVNSRNEWVLQASMSDEAIDATFR